MEVSFNIEEMFSLRRAGWKIAALARKYGKDRSTIRHHCNWGGIVPEVVISARSERLVQETEKVVFAPVEAVLEPPDKKYAYLLHPKTKKTRSYKSYLKEALKRPAESHYFQTERLVIPNS